MSFGKYFSWKSSPHTGPTKTAEISIGIDLGYRQGCVGVHIDDKTSVIPAEDGKQKTPLYISYAYDNKRQQFTNLVGSKALEARESGQKCVYDTKLLIGRSKEQKEVQNLIRSKYFPFSISGTEVAKIALQYSHWRNDAEYFLCEELTAKVLVHLKQVAENHLNHMVSKAVITVPASFNSFQRLAVANSGKLAGIKDVVIITEATAAVVAYYHGFPTLTEEILVFDLGLRSFDLTLLSVKEGKIHVRAATTDLNLNGSVVTKNLKKHVQNEFRDTRRKDYNYKFDNALQDECEAKKKLFLDENCESVIIGYMGYNYGRSTVSRHLFSEINRDFVAKCFATLDNFLADSKFKESRIKRVLLVGGSSQLPGLKERMKVRFPHVEVTNSLNPEVAVATGAAIHAKSPKFKEIGYEEDFKDNIQTIPVFGVITSGDLGVHMHSSSKRPVEALSSGVIIPRGTQTPCHLRKRFKCGVKDREVTVDVHQGQKPKLIENKILSSLKLKNSDLPEDGVCHFDIDMYLSADGLLRVQLKIVGWFTDTDLGKKDMTIAKDYSVNFLKELKDYGTKFSENACQIWSTLNQVLTVDVYSGGQIDVAKASYQERMDAAVSTFEVIPEQKLKALHDQAMTIALGALMSAHPLTSDGYQEAKKPLEALYSKYQNINWKKQLNPCKYTVGLDLGTTYCSAAYVETGRAKAIPIDRTGEGEGTKFRSVLAIDGKDSITCGSSAKLLAYEHSENLIFDLKRMIGQHIKDSQIIRMKRYWPFIIGNNNGNIEIKSHGVAFRPEELLVKIIESIKESVAEYLKEEMVNVVVAIPANFKPLQVRLTKQACLDAGLNVIQLVQEPIAAALAYSHENEIEKDSTVMIVDLGGGTFDIAVVQIKTKGIKILDFEGDPFLGGQDVDNALVDYCIQEFERLHGINVREQPGFSRLIRRLKDMCETAKRHLSVVQHTRLMLDAFHGQTDLDLPLNREKLENLISTFVDKCMEVISRITSKNQIDRVVLVGGSSSMPIIRRKLEGLFGDKVIRDRTIQADLAVASGAAVLGSLLQNHRGDVVVAEEKQTLILTEE